MDYASVDVKAYFQDLSTIFSSGPLLSSVALHPAPPARLVTLAPSSVAPLAVGQILEDGSVSGIVGVQVHRLGVGEGRVVVAVERVAGAVQPADWLWLGNVAWVHVNLLLSAWRTGHAELGQQRRPVPAAALG